jgi:hypothetical protein
MKNEVAGFVRKNHRTLGGVFGALFVFGVGILAGRGCGGAPDAGQVASTVVTEQQIRPTVTQVTTHSVRRGEFLKSIALQHGVWWEEILLANERFLRAKYDEVCADFKRRNVPGRKGLFCNDRYNRPYGNTLLPGWTINVPLMDAPEPINAAVVRTGERVAIVIDDTGSMQEDRSIVAQLYLAALRQHGRTLVGVWMYADGEVREYDAGSVRTWTREQLQQELQTAGNVENTYGALRMAKRANPDSIILITDEPGDDWPSTIQFDVPVVATCLPDRGNYTCEGTLQDLARNSGGQYVAYRQ